MSAEEYPCICPANAAWETLRLRGWTIAPSEMHKGQWNVSQARKMWDDDPSIIARGNTPYEAIQNAMRGVSR